MMWIFLHIFASVQKKHNKQIEYVISLFRSWLLQAISTCSRYCPSELKGTVVYSIAERAEANSIRETVDVYKALSELCEMTSIAKLQMESIIVNDNNIVNFEPC